MKLWLDAHFSPMLATWIQTEYHIETLPVRDLGMQEAMDIEIFQHAKQRNVCFMTKDSDFVDLFEKFGPPPQIIWIRCRKTSNASMIKFYQKRFLTCCPCYRMMKDLLKSGNAHKH